VPAPARGEALRCHTPVLQGSSILAAAGIVNMAVATSTGAALTIDTLPSTSTAADDNYSNTVHLVPIATEASMNVSQHSVPAVAGQQQISTAVHTGTVIATPASEEAYRNTAATGAADAAAEGQHTDKRDSPAASMIGAVLQCTEFAEQPAANSDAATADAKERCAAVTVITENNAAGTAADAVGCEPVQQQQPSSAGGAKRITKPTAAPVAPAPQSQQHTNRAGLSKVHTKQVAAVATKPPAPQQQQQISTAGLNNIHTKPVACDQQQQEQTSIAHTVMAKPVAAVAAAAAASTPQQQRTSTAGVNKAAALLLMSL
jgi:hypothetical protein